MLSTGRSAHIVMPWSIWDHLYNLKNVKNTHEGVLPLFKLQALAKTTLATLLKLTLLHEFFSHFLYSANGTKSRKVSNI